VSELGASDGAHPWLVNAGIVVLGVSLLALAVALASVLPRRRVLPALLFSAAGLAMIAAAAFPLDCGIVSDQRCSDRFDAGELSWQTTAHVWSDLVGQVALLLTPFALARALWRSTPAAAALYIGAVGVVIAAASVAVFVTAESAGGLMQRVLLLTLHMWVLIVGCGVLHATRGPALRSDVIPMRPREFFARSWTGTGELVLRPLVLGRRFRLRGAATRESAFVSDTTWRIDDAVDFGDGHVERRRMFLELVADGHVRVTADDLVDGIEVWLEPDGFRMSDWRMAWPIGPLPLLVRCADRSYFEPDGEFVNVIDVYTPGPRIPLARVTFRMRPVAGPEIDPLERAMELS
jgi:hypothetical protein